jgi:hypothetical protein
MRGLAPIRPRLARDAILAVAALGVSAVAVALTATAAHRGPSAACARSEWSYNSIWNVCVEPSGRTHDVPRRELQREVEP